MTGYITSSVFIETLSPIDSDRRKISSVGSGLCEFSWNISSSSVEIFVSSPGFPCEISSILSQ